MIKFIKKSKITIISIAILIIWVTYSMIKMYQYMDDVTDPMIAFYQNLLGYFWYMQILAPLFVFIPAIWNFHKELSTGFIKNCLTRTDYRKYMLKKYLKTLPKALILPCLVLILLFLSCILVGNFEIGHQPSLYGYYFSPDPKYLDILGWYIFVLVINLFLHSILYINIGLLCCKKHANILVTLVLAYLSFTILGIILEIFVGDLFCFFVLDIHATTTLQLSNIWAYNNVPSLPLTVIYALVLVAISTFMVYLKYKNKEGVIIEIEK